MLYCHALCVDTKQTRLDAQSRTSTLTHCVISSSLHPQARFTSSCLNAILQVCEVQRTKPPGTVIADDTDEGYFFLEAFSSMPDVPNRLRSSFRTSSTGTACSRTCPVTSTARAWSCCQTYKHACLQSLQPSDRHVKMQALLQRSVAQCSLKQGY